jgi:hypothetical protein
MSNSIMNDEHARKVIAAMFEYLCVDKVENGELWYLWKEGAVRIGHVVNEHDVHLSLQVMPGAVEPIHYAHIIITDNISMTYNFRYNNCTSEMALVTLIERLCTMARRRIGRWAEIELKVLQHLRNAQIKENSLHVSDPGVSSVAPE